EPVFRPFQISILECLKDVLRLPGSVDDQLLRVEGKGEFVDVADEVCFNQINSDVEDDPFGPGSIDEGMF
ncbi:hypothetical protein GP486_008976, partial [Trichoglossum hirsutum]